MKKISVNLFNILEYYYRDNLQKNYEEKVKICQKLEEDYNSALKKFLTTCQKMENKRLTYGYIIIYYYLLFFSLLLKSLNDILESYGDTYSKGKAAVGELKYIIVVMIIVIIYHYY
jgi:hypothetical protein